jgi:hypothetical protein
LDVWGRRGRDSFHSNKFFLPVPVLVPPPLPCIPCIPCALVAGLLCSMVSSGGREEEEEARSGAPLFAPPPPSSSVEAPGDGGC